MLGLGALPTIVPPRPNAEDLVLGRSSDPSPNSNSSSSSKTVLGKQAKTEATTTWDLGDFDPLGIALGPDDSVYVVGGPLQTQSNFETLRRYDSSGALLDSFVLRDSMNAELRPLDLDIAGDGRIFVATENLLILVDAMGEIIWEAPAGDAHPDFGPAARGLAVHPSTGRIFGLDMLNARLLGYDSGNGQLRQRLGTFGSSPGSYLSPVDIAIGPGQGPAADHLFIAERGKFAHSNTRRPRQPARPLEPELSPASAGYQRRRCPGSSF